jgi:hypothetical protein
MKKEVKKALEKFVKASPSTKVLFLIVSAILLSALIYCIFMLLIVK